MRALGLAAVVVLCSVCAMGQTVEGSVTNSITGAGIAGVKVEIVAVPEDIQVALLGPGWTGSLTGLVVYSTTTDQQGFFRIENIKEGSYSIRSPYLMGYLNLNAPAMHPFHVDRTGRVVRNYRLTPLGAISGRVIDNKGVGVRRAQVDVRSATLIMSASTDADGKFQAWSLPPGVYTLAVSPPADLKPPEPEPGSDQVLGWARTYYPGVPFPEAASTVVVAPGGQPVSIEIKLLVVPAHAIRGVLLSPDGSPAPKVSIVFRHGDMSQPVRVESNSDGAFEFPAAIDGAWHLTTEVVGPEKWRLRELVRIAGHDVTDVKLRLEPPFVTPGKVVLEIPRGWAAPRPLVVHLTPVWSGEVGLDLLSSSDEEGNFSLERSYPGEYNLDSPAPPGYYLDAVRLGGAELRAPAIELSSGAPLTLVYKTNGGAVRGTVEDCASARIVLTPRDPALRWPDMIMQGRCDPQGRYEIPAVRPGEYYVLALWAGIPFRAVDDGLLSQAVAVSVSAGAAASADLRVIRAPR